MHRILIVLLMLTAGMAHARILHVGDNTIKLSQTKTTTPALHVRVGDEVWYGAMCTNNQKNTLHVKFNNIIYDVIEPFTDTTNYTYDEFGRLIGANENLYLESTGTQYIDTLHIPTLVTRSEMYIRFSDDEYKQGVGNGRCFGVIDRINKSNYTINWTNNTVMHAWLCLWHSLGGMAWCNARYMTINKDLKTTKQLVVLDAKNNYIQYADQKIVLQERQTTEKYSIYLFGSHVVETSGVEYASVYDSNNYVYIYSTKIYEDDTLIRHFVPVPCGLKIGDFVVPENGMWDIVEQKFYGNMGTGEFIYGVDE